MLWNSFLCGILQFFLVVSFGLSVVHADNTCGLTCETGATCYTDVDTAINCMASMPFNQKWANATLDTLMQSLENFGFGALYHNTGPPYSINLDIQGELAATVEMVENGEFTSDLLFQEHVQSIFQRTIDAHTRYSKPVCYNAIFIQPFAFDLRIIPDPQNPVLNEPTLYVMENLYTADYKKFFPQYAATVDLLLTNTQSISLLNGIESTTEISQWGDTHETRSNNRGVRFNAAYRSYLYRSATSYNIYPINDLSITLLDGSTYTLPWLVSYKTGFSDVSVCAAITPTSSPTASPTDAPMTPLAIVDRKKKSESLPLGIHRKPIKIDDHPVQHLDSEILSRSSVSGNDRTIIIPSNSSFYVSCFTQHLSPSTTTKAAGVNNVLVMKVSSFSPPGDDYVYAWQHFLNDTAKCLSTSYDMIVVDVMQNGGGYVCLGTRMLEMLIEEYNVDHTHVQMNYDFPHSDLMTKYVNELNQPSPYDESILDPTTDQPFPDGKAYYYPGRNVTQGGVLSRRTNFFTLDCRDAEIIPYPQYKPPRFMDRDHLVILTDGTCGSTCASFTKIPQEGDKATFVGAGGLWDENMDVCSFAGGFVSNPDYFKEVAAFVNESFPSFLTNQRWQFGWGTWYSRKLPTRQSQFTEQTPAHRQPFWGFPHASISPAVTTVMVSDLYDKVIAANVVRLAEINTFNSYTDSASCQLSHDEVDFLTALAIIFGILFILISVTIIYVYRKQRDDGRTYSLVSH